MTVVYVTEPGAAVCRTYGRLRISKQGKTLHEVRLADVERLVLFGGVQLTTQAATCLMEEGIETAFLSSHGVYRGRLAPAVTRGISLRLQQYRTYSDMVGRMALARAMVKGKIRNGEALLAQFARNHPEIDTTREREQMQRARLGVMLAADTAQLLGWEGQAANAYFGGFGRLLRHGFSFRLRSRRPPRDPANALLSFGYALLVSETTSAVAAHGLDPGLGMLHALDEGRPSLGLDLAEEFRHPIVDRFVLHLANNRILTEADFEGSSAGGFLLRPSARKQFLELYEERMTAPFHGTRDAGCMREVIRVQARALSEAFRSAIEYRAFVLR